MLIHRPISGLTALAYAFGVAVMCAMPLHAHHGWQWAEGQSSDIMGKITAARLGNPHGTLTLDVNGQSWTIEVGQPWRNHRAGLKDEMLVKDVSLTIRGNKSARKGERLMKAIRVIIDGKTYDLYPERK